MKKTRAALVFAIIVGLSAAAAAQTPPTAGDELVAQKCIFCHTGHRIYNADPEKIKELVARMEAKNPEWFKDADKGHLVEALTKMLNDPQIAARRAAWEALVAKGKEIFADVSLGKMGKSCASCHQPEALRGVSDGYPAFDKALSHFISLQERLQIMIVTKLDGPVLPLGDQRTVALEAYLKSLR